MAVTFDAGTGGSQANSATLTIAHTVTAGGSDRIIYFIFGGWDGNLRTATATYAGAPMTQEAISALSNGNDRVWVFRLENPTTGTNNAVATITGGNMHLIGGCLSWTNAHQTVFGTAFTAVSSVGGTAASVDVTDGASGDGIADGVITGNDNTHLVNGPASHTERWDQTLGASGEAGAGGNSDGAAGTVTVGWTISQSASWAHGAVTVKQVAGAVASQATWNMGLLGVN